MLDGTMGASEILADALEEERPVILFAGQQLYAPLRGIDAVLSAAIARLGRSTKIGQGWRALLDDGGLSDADYEWLSERFERSVPSEPMRALLDVHWSAIFTTSIDSTLARRLRGHLYKLLSNPIYAGKIAHKGEQYDGQHAAIIDQKTWDAVQAQLAANNRRQKNGGRAKDPMGITMPGAVKINLLIRPR